METTIGKIEFSANSKTTDGTFGCAPNSGTGSITVPQMSIKHPKSCDQDGHKYQAIVTAMATAASGAVIYHHLLFCEKCGDLLPLPNDGR